MRPGRTRNTWLTLVVVTGLAAYQYFYPDDPGLPAEERAGLAANSVQSLFAARQSGVWLDTEGRITRILADDNEGSRHQRFILDVGDGHTVMVAHNIDLAQRVPVRQGESVSLHGRFEWNERGGVIHWTHHDPDGMQEGGWIQWQGELYK